jgi:alpha-N-acetylglucosaminidase
MIFKNKFFMLKRIIPAGLLAALFFQVLAVRGERTDDTAVRGLIGRILPAHENDFVLETISSTNGENVFEVEARDGKIILRGDNQLSQAVAFNWYLKHDALVDVSWYADDAVNVPEKLPRPVEKIRRATKLKDRFFLNYCTFGYTTPFWHWRDWERCIDWMALNGINLPLAQNGNEFIWQKVWRGYGLSDEEIRNYFTGPAYLPWHRMVNIDHWDGPLPQSFIDGQRDLQKQILARERELGMSPVLCAFSGHVPEALKAKQPVMNIQQIPPIAGGFSWGGLDAQDGCWFLSPLDPKFKEIQVKFLQEQEKEYGTSHYYGTDPFNEIDPPSWEPSYLASVARTIYGSMAQVDPDAVWLQMAWTFSYKHKDWTDERLSALINAVPQGRMVLIDYFCEDKELFRDTKNFYGAPFIWDYLGNFGGNTHLVGPVNKINQKLTRAMDDASLTNLIGVGGTLEGFNNPVVYEMLFDRVWAGTNLNVSAWIKNEARSRAGIADANFEAAWDVLHNKVLVDNTTAIHGHGVIFQESNPSLRGDSSRLSAKVDYDNKDLVRAWQLLLQANPDTQKTSAYQRDLVDTTRQALGNLALNLREQMAVASDKKDAVAFAVASEKFMTLGSELDQFLGTRSEFMLGKWIGDARSWAGNSDDPAYFEKDARSLITIWGGHLNDYAGRQWNGLLRDYYLPRWQLLIDAKLAELKGAKPVDRKTLEKSWRAHDLKFATTAGGNYAAQPHGDYFAMSQSLFAKYSSLATNSPPLLPSIDIESSPARKPKLQ